MGKGGISNRLLDCAGVFFGRMYGGLGIVTVVACMFFAAISGSGRYCCCYWWYYNSSDDCSGL